MKTLSSRLPSLENAFVAFFVIFTACLVLFLAQSELLTHYDSHPSTVAADSEALNDCNAQETSIAPAIDDGTDDQENYSRKVRFIECDDCLPDGKVIVRFIRNSRILDVGSF